MSDTAARQWFISCGRGIQGLLANELNALGIAGVQEKTGGVACRDDLQAAYRICLWSRLASRVLMPLRTFSVKTPEDLYQGVHGIDWARHFTVDNSFIVDFSGTGAGINHTRYGAQRVKDAVVDYFRARDGRRPDVQADWPDIRLNVRLHRERVVLSLDFSGESLHQRRYRERGTVAPLKENLAAALLIRAGWPDPCFAALVDPMCGSGTLLIEAAMMAADIAPGLGRLKHGFERWQGHQPELWRQLLDEAKVRRDKGLAGDLPLFAGYDHHQRAIEASGLNIEAAGVDECIRLRQQGLDELRNPLTNRAGGDREKAPGRGLIITNPPYGERMGEEQALMAVYRDLGAAFREHFGGWRAAVFSANQALCFELGLRADRQYKFFNGPIETRLLLFDIYTDGQRPQSKRAGTDETNSAGQKHHSASAGESGFEPELSAGAEMLANRLRKNQRKLRAWLKKEQIECYRLYDADLPEYSVAIDCYGEAVHVQEYAPPDNVDTALAARRLQEVRAAVKAVLKPGAGLLFFKQRQRQRGEQQYQRLGRSGQKGVFVVSEQEACFEVNLAAYLDTGLFLDHRPVRKLLAQLCAGKRFLNLFCYTASATVRAVQGGARESLSVDLSASYLDWARRNFGLNGIDESRHRLLRTDCLEWLARGADKEAGQFEVIFLDPPTFSNSKSMGGTLDVQRDHERLISQAMALLTDDGVLVFSTNRRRFKLSDTIAAGFAVEDITSPTIDRDFARRKNIHHCWCIRHQPGAGGQ